MCECECLRELCDGRRVSLSGCTAGVRAKEVESSRDADVGVGTRCGGCEGCVDVATGQIDANYAHCCKAQRGNRVGDAILDKNERPRGHG